MPPEERPDGPASAPRGVGERAETETVAEPLPPPARSARGDFDPLAPGVALGRYVVLEQLGSGGMGRVYAAYDRDLDRKVALKLLLPAAAGAGEPAQIRLLREAQAMAQLAHPNVVAVHDVGTVGGRVYVAMEFVRGVTLRRWRAERPRTWREVAEAFRAAGAGLAAAHRAGLVHRDFKPDNVMVSEDGRVRVMDFGLARRAAGEAAAVDAVAPETAEGPATGGSPTPLDSPLTHAGAVLGTPAYMAPEQILGRGADARSDQFGFCAAFYEALYGEHPFAGTTAAELMREALAGRVREAPPGSDVPGRLRRLLLRGLSAEPAARYPSMDALLAELAADPAGRRRRRLLAAGVALAAAAATVAFVVLRVRAGLCSGAESRLASVWSSARKGAIESAFLATGKPWAATVWHTVERQLDAYGASWAKMHRAACEATRLRGEQSEALLDLRMACLDRRLADFAALAELFSRPDPQVRDQVLDMAVEAADALPGLAECADARALTARVTPPSEPAARARVGELETRLAATKALSDTALWDRAMTEATAAVATARELHYPPTEAEALELEGQVEDGLGRYPDSHEHLYDAVLAAQAGADDARLARAALDLAWVAGVQQGHPADGQPWLRLAEATITRLGGSKELEALLTRGRAQLAEAGGQYEEAVEQARRGLALVATTLGPESAEAAQIRNDEGVSLTYLGRYDEALATYDAGLAIYRKLYGPEHPAVADALDNVAGVYWSRRDLPKALEVGQQALAMRRKTLPPDHPSIATSLNTVAQTLQNLGRVEESIQYQLEAVAIQEKALGPEHPMLAGSLNNLAYAYRRLGRYDEALAQFPRAIAMFEHTVGPEHPYLAFALSGLGQTYLEVDRAADAVAPLERALAIRRKAGAEPRNLASSDFALARALWASGRDRARAHRLAEEALGGYQKAGDNFVKERDRVAAWLAHPGARQP